ncbi:DUF4190 domain-containing protein [Streptomyces sp. IMTB 2501]|uniref:DUF4190 domain-containing protein n=1 Tax=Streptomyces sp. IMTB 2501 TaxID=1776340 RepID=UPI00096BFDD5|nr:DUF4190 domain-containing protein [Streptomyces sp. IMTB 2501]OLZ66950.1 DUF4190 domain-containing protein [Streptomyces sp. IMTB 2501]
MSDGAQPSGAPGGDYNPWAPPEHRPSLEKKPPEPQDQAPAQPPSVHDQATVISLPTDGFTPPMSPPGFAPPAAASGFGVPGAAPMGAEAVPPPPIAPSGPGIPAPPASGGYGYPGYPAGYGWPGMPMAPQNGMGVAALVLGILSICLFCLYGVVSLVLGILAVVFGIKGRRRAELGEASNHGQAQAGLIMGIIGIVLGIAVIVLLAIGITTAINDSRTHSDPYDDSARSVSVTVAADR